MVREKRFYDALEEIFVGAKIEGAGGYVNLLKIKEKYYAKILGKFQNDVNNCEIINGAFREEFFDKLYAFFEKYFSESGSVYFVKTANWQNVYEKVYTDNRDVVLFWKTHMLYYVKSDILFQSIDVAVRDEKGDEDHYFHFAVGTLETKQHNENREIIYAFREQVEMNVKDRYGNQVRKRVCVFDVQYSTHGRKTDINGIVKDTNIPNVILDRAFAAFEKQSKVDFFINKNANAFLTEQLDLYLHQILLETENIFGQQRLDQIKTIKTFALKLIDFISQFEDELVRIWNKPKFVTDSNYVFTLKTIKELVEADYYENLLQQVRDHINTDQEYRADVIETIREIYKQPLQRIYVHKVVIENGIKIEYVKSFKDRKRLTDYLESNPSHKEITEDVTDRGRNLEGFFATYSSDNLCRELSLESLYIDTKYFSPEFRSEILAQVSKSNAIDDVLDGYLVYSDNYHFLSSAMKFRENIDLIYIDPPFNTEGSYAYLDKFKDSTWLSMINDRLLQAKRLLSEQGSFYIHLDHHCNFLGRLIADAALGFDLKREIIWNTSPSLSGLKTAAHNFIRQHDTILFYAGDGAGFNKMYVNYTNAEIEGLGWLDIFRDDEKGLYIHKYTDGAKQLNRHYLDDISVMAIGDTWNDVYSMMYTQNMTRENWGVDNTQKPENLLRRIIQASTNQKEWVMDFYAGTGTTIAAAHKLNRRWVGVEAGGFIESVTLRRMKTVVMGDIRPKLSIDLNWQGGGFFKYYSLEQYEDTLRNMHYKDDQATLFDETNPYGAYIFFADNKLTDVLEIEGDDLKLEFAKLYKNIDWPETISNLLGLPLKGIYPDTFVLQDGDTEIKIRTDFDKMTSSEKLEFLQLIKPLLWWGE